MFTVFTSGVYGQRPEADFINTSEGPLVIQPVLHGSLILSWKDGLIYVDPYGGLKRYEDFNKPEIILITDIHGDHFNQKTLDSLNTTTAKFIVPKAVNDMMSDPMKGKARIISNGEQLTINGIKIEAIPMYNLPNDETARHPKGRGNGYILTFGDTRLYISGDTEDISEMRNLENIDIAFVCMNLPYTMSVDQAASAVNEFKPKIVYPFHYRGKDGLSDVENFKRIVESQGLDVDVRLRNWYVD